MLSSIIVRECRECHHLFRQKRNTSGQQDEICAKCSPSIWELGFQNGWSTRIYHDTQRIEVFKNGVLMHSTTSNIKCDFNPFQWVLETSPNNNDTPRLKFFSSQFSATFDTIDLWYSFTIEQYGFLSEHVPMIERNTQQLLHDVKVILHKRNPVNDK